MDYKVVVTKDAEEDLERFIRFMKNNRLFTRETADDIIISKLYRRRPMIIKASAALRNEYTIVLKV